MYLYHDNMNLTPARYSSITRRFALTKQGMLSNKKRDEENLAYVICAGLRVFVSENNPVAKCSSSRENK